MPKLLLALITGVMFSAGAASAQTAPSTSPDKQNPEATCPSGANCAPGQASPSPARRDSDAGSTGSTARQSSDPTKDNPEHTCPPGSKC
jgi:hypothetical protein